MLRSFRVANHKSIRKEAELLLMPAYDKSRPVVPVAGIFGANASGKSNLLDALRWMQDAVRTSFASWEPGAGVPRYPFRLDPKAAAEPSYYVIEMVVDGVRYTYGFEVDDVRVREEWLYAYPRNRKRVIFERELDSWTFGSTVPRARLDLLRESTRDNALFLSVAARSELDEATPVYRWFSTGLRLADPAGRDLSRDLIERLGRDSPPRQSIVDLARAADLGIVDIVVDETRGGMVLWDPVVEDVGSAASERFRQTGRILAGRDARGPHGIVEASGDDIRKLADVRNRMSALLFLHGGSHRPLTLAEQSAGTRAWLSMASAVLDTLDRGGVLLVDEIDASLHSHLTARLINLFRDPETNPWSAQLLFTTHDTALLDEYTLARDEIWFVEKDADSGVTRLYPLTDFHPRKNENTEGRYLAGAYGAIPLLTDYEFREAIGGRADDEAA